MSGTENQGTVKLAAPVTPPPKASAPTISRRGVGFSLRYKIFGGVLLLVLSTVGAVLVVVQQRATAVTRRTIDEGMKRAGSVLATWLEGKFERIASSGRQFADDPNTKGALTTYDSATVFDYLAAKAQAVLGAQSVLALDREGYLLARSDRPGVAGDPLGTKSPLFSLPLEGKIAMGYAESQGQLLRMVGLPVFVGEGELAGAIAIAHAVDAPLTAEARDIGRAEATFFVIDREGGWSVGATTLAADEAAALATALKGAPALADAARREVAGPLEVALGEDPNIVVAVPLHSASGERVGVLVGSRSLFKEMAAFREIRMTIMIVGGAAILLALIVSFFMANRITRPVRALVAATEKVKEGELDVTLPATENDEIGLLSESFGRMLVELKQKAELEDYLDSMQMTGVVGMGGTTPIPMGGGTTVLPTSATASGATASGGTRAVDLDKGAIFAGRYEIEQVLGAGAMGKVYRAKDKELDEEVAIKTIKSEVISSDPDAIERFKSELRSARKIANKHVLKTFHFGDAEGVHYITMEYFHSVMLKYLIRQKGAFPVGPGVHLAKQICDGLGAAHEQGVVHRDIKPQNMLVNTKGDLKLMDFGIARATEGKGLTQTGMVMGTPDYMSPEQGQGRPADHRSDLYSVGIVLYELFTGELPFTAENAIGMVMQHIQAPPPHARQKNSKIPLELDAIIVKAMGKNPASRFQSAEELHQALDEIKG